MNSLDTIKKRQLFSDTSVKGEKDGIPIEKGVVLNEDYLKKIKSKLGIFFLFLLYIQIYF